MLPPRLAAALCLALVVAGCAEAPTPQPTPVAGAGAASPLAGLPECPSLPAGDTDDVEGLLLPEGSVVNGVTRQEPLVTVTAFVPLTPVQFEAAYPDMDGITVMVTENEIYEAELLVGDGAHRNFLKATAICDQGSNVLAVVAPEVDAKGLPLPQRATATPSPGS